ncbi:hypothetical protein FRC03_003678 [Tulasnella sp. 419]|nr:hypothetical protein FRC02_000897 [Tulasnella sp. 418]KAG8942079.1 hypothetical protein FRC03_003678 [Tulasnella sp. 419]
MLPALFSESVTLHLFLSTSPNLAHLNIRPAVLVLHGQTFVTQKGGTIFSISTPSTSDAASFDAR